MSAATSQKTRRPQSSAAETLARETFQALLSALSNPGHMFALPGTALSTRQACLQIGLTLLDLETSFFTLDPALGAALGQNGARLLPASSAAYLFFPDSAVFTGPAAAQTLTCIEQAAVGTVIDPDDGATLIIACGLGAGRLLHLQGPGIQDRTEVRVDHLSPDFWQLRAAKIRYPLGIDLFLVDGGQVVGLPRTTLVEMS